MSKRTVLLALLAVVLVLPFTAFGLFISSSGATSVSLGNASSFGVLAYSTVTNAGLSVVEGNVGVSPGTSVTGFPPGTLTGSIHAGDAVAAAAQADTITAYNDLTSQACTSDLSGQDLGGKTLTPGVYCFSSSAQLTGTLTLDAQNSASAVFIFKIGSTLDTATGSSVAMINGGNECNVFWQVGSSATLGTTTAFAGNILALASITLDPGAIVSGRVLAQTGAVALDTNQVDSSMCVSGTTSTTTTPPPSLVDGSITWTTATYQGSQYIFPASVAINGKQFSTTFYESIFAQYELVPGEPYAGYYSGSFGAISGCQPGSTITITATVNGVTESASGLCPAEGATSVISLVFGNQYQVTVSSSPSNGGTTSPSGSSWFNAGSTLQIASTPASGYEFSSWSSSGSITLANPKSTSTAAVINGPGTITANFMAVTTTRASTRSTTSTTTTTSSPTTSSATTSSSTESTTTSSTTTSSSSTSTTSTVTTTPSTQSSTPITTSSTTTTSTPHSSSKTSSPISTPSRLLEYLILIVVLIAIVGGGTFAWTKRRHRREKSAIGM
ncbi:MAG: ice-binding family protein [Nitrososphaerales archaeon]